ncbi:hypothetical protein KCU78_g29, partial [Aureobasidium melanogenum]
MFRNPKLPCKGISNPASARYFRGNGWFGCSVAWKRCAFAAVVARSIETYERGAPCEYGCSSDSAANSLASSKSGSDRVASADNETREELMRRFLHGGLLKDSCCVDPTGLPSRYAELSWRREMVVAALPSDGVFLPKVLLRVEVTVRRLTSAISSATSIFSSSSVTGGALPTLKTKV